MIVPSDLPGPGCWDGIVTPLMHAAAVARGGRSSDFGCLLCSKKVPEENSVNAHLGSDKHWAVAEPGVRLWGPKHTWDSVTRQAAAPLSVAGGGRCR